MVRTHTFRLGKYYIDQESNTIYGLCDIPDKYEKLRMVILGGRDFKSLVSTLHEAMHAEGVCDSKLHGEVDSAETIARFLWRLGYRRLDDPES